METNRILTVGAVGGLVLIAANSWTTIFLFTAIFGAVVMHEYIQGPSCTSKEKLDGKVVVITGANTGIGKETAIDLARRGAKLIIGCRNAEKSARAIDHIKSLTGRQVDFIRLDLNSLKSVREFAAELTAKVDHVDILINNAGVMMPPKTTTEDGNEMQFQTNHLGHFLLTNLLLPVIKKAEKARIVNVSSLAHKWCKGINFDDINSISGYSRTKAYGQSKLANIMFTAELARRLEGTNVNVYCLHPGAIATELNRHINDMFPEIVNKLMFGVAKFFLKTPLKGAQTTIYCAVEKSLDNETGKYYADCALSEPSKAAKDVAAQTRLWALSKDMVGFDENEATLIRPGIEDIVQVTHKVDGKSSSSSSSDDEEPEKERVVVESTEKSRDFSENPERKAEIVEEVVRDTALDLLGNFRPTPDKETREETKEPEKKEEVGIEVSQSNKDLFSQVTDELKLTDQPMSTLHHAETKEANILPDKYDILREKAADNLLAEVESFEPEKLNPVTPVESDPLVQMTRQENLIKNIEGFDAKSLKSNETLEKVTLPSKEDIEAERSIIEEETEANKSTFQTAVVDQVEGFDASSLKHVEDSETTELSAGVKEAYVREKTHEHLMKDLSDFEETTLHHVKTPEPLSGSELAKSEINRATTLEEVSNFDKTTLKTTNTEEKNALPKTEDINVEKKLLAHEDVMKEVAEFESASLKATEVEEKSRLPTSDDINSERLHRELITNIDEFDPLSLAKTETEEKQTLPDAETIQKEKMEVGHVSQNFEAEVAKAVGGQVDEITDDRQRSSSGESSGSQKTKGSSDSWEKVES